MGFEYRPGKYIFFSLKPFSLAQRSTQRPIQWVSRFFAGVKAAGREVGHLPPSSATVKNERAVLLLPVYAFMAWTGTISHRRLVANTILIRFTVVGIGLPNRVFLYCFRKKSFFFN